jgi:hypothetical protein
MISASGSPSSLMIVNTDKNNHKLSHIDLSKLLKPGDARLDISHIASASLSLSVFMSHISKLVDEIRTQIKTHVGMMNQLRTSIATHWIEVEGGSGFPAQELIDFYETWIPSEQMSALLKLISPRMIARVEKHMTGFKESMAFAGMNLYVGIMHAMTEFERLDGGEKVGVENEFFGFLRIIEADFLLNIDEEVRFLFLCV